MFALAIQINVSGRNMKDIARVQDFIHFYVLITSNLNYRPSFSLLGPKNCFCSNNATLTDVTISGRPCTQQSGDKIMMAE